MAGVLVAAEPEDPRGIVVENVALLAGGQERRLGDDRDRSFDDTRPHHLVRAERDPLLESGFDQPLKVAIARRSGLLEDDDARVDMDLRVRVEHGEHVVEHRAPGVHDVDAERRVSDEHRLQRERREERRPVPM